MTVLIPTNSTSRHEAQISSMEENQSWAFVTLDEGQIESCNFFERREDILEWIDAVVVINEQEYVWPFMEEGVIVLIAPVQRSIDEIIEAFLFKELHDLSV